MSAGKQQRRSSVSALLERHGALVFPGVYDGLSALIARRSGFELAFVTGYGVAASRLGLPDMGYVDGNDICDSAAKICAAIDIPLLVDADTGYGNELNVQRTVKRLVRAGAKGCFLEDQQWPKRCGHMRGKQVIDAAHYADKIAAAAAARGDADFFIVARTDALATDGIDEAVARMQAAKRAGADGFFIEAPGDLEQMRAVCAATPKPLVANMIEGGKTPVLSKQELADIGYQLILYPLTGLYSAARAVTASFAGLRASDTSDAAKLTTFAEFNELIGADKLLPKD